jgi:ArsR family transcriptional regulator, arsenate/arsenite/antimonite-responsive transcriptional repressor / arsenate reductase (thioredoxin)
MLTLEDQSVKLESMNSEQTPELQRRARMHAALADEARLRIVDLLAVGDHSPSELGVELGIASNLLAHHLKVLQEAGLVSRHRSDGDRRRTYLTLTGDGLTSRARVGSMREAVQVRHVLFVCTANTARSHLAAALWRQASSVETSSAGTHPGERVHPGALATARRHHLELPDVPPRPLPNRLGAGDLVITVCDRAHEEVGHLTWAHWSIPDPVAVGTRAAFEAAHDALRPRIESLATRVGSTA